MNRKPLLAAVNKMKEEMMLLGFISLLLAASSNGISSICIPSKFYNGAFHPCSKPLKNLEVEETKNGLLNELNGKAYKKGYEPFVSDQGLDQLHHFIFVMSITHVSYSCLTMLLTIVKIHTWRKWEDDAQMEEHGVLTEISKNETMRRQSAIVKFHLSNPWSEIAASLGWCVSFNNLAVQLCVLITLHCMKPSSCLQNHNLTSKDSWIELVLLLGAKLQHVIATLALESAGITGYFNEARLKPRHELFWFKNPELLLSLDPQRIRETIQGWRKEAKRRRKLSIYNDDSTIRTETSTVISLDEFDHQELDSPQTTTPPDEHLQVELRPSVVMTPSAPLLRPSASLSSSSAPMVLQEPVTRSNSLPAQKQ